MSRLHKFRLLSQQELVDSPSSRDGVPESMEHRRRRLAAQHMRAASFDFRMSITTWAIAVTFFNRFYASKSMKKNNAFVIACASLFLAGKVNDEARSHEKLANELVKAWFGKDNPQLQAQTPVVPQQQHRGTGGAHAVTPPPPRSEFWTNMYDAVLEAERALLYTIGFDFNIDIIHTHLARLLKRPRFAKLGLRLNTAFQQHLINMANDVYTKDGTLVLQYPVDTIALALYYFVFKTAKAHKIASIPQPEPGAGGAPWYIEEGLTTADCVAITNRLSDRLYHKSQQTVVAARKPGASAAGTMGASSTALLGACESAAYTGAPSLLGGATGRSELASGGGDTLGEHTSVPRHLSSDVAAHFSKRKAEGPTGPAGNGAPSGPTKRARMATPAVAAGCSNEATSGAVRTAAYAEAGCSAGSPSYTPTGPGAAASAGATPAAPSAANKIPHPGQPAAAVPAADAAVVAAAAAPDSDKEEGELEEGEL